MSHRLPDHARLLFRRLVLGAAVVALLSRTTPACGPWYDEPSIINASKDELLHLPSARFYDEIKKLKFPKAPFPEVDTSSGDTNVDQNLSIDLIDLQAALTDKQIAPPQWPALVLNVTQIRTTYRTHAEVLDRWNEQDPARRGAAPVAPNVDVDPQLPAEFFDYLSGWKLYECGRFKEARVHWNRLLARPAADRAYRGAWAAYMMGRSFQKEDPAEAIKWFNKTRFLVQNGAKDSLGLAFASYGWEARAELDQKHYERAIELYMLQEYYTSLQTVAARAFADGPDALKRLAKHDGARAVLTVYVVAMGGPWRQPPKAELVRVWLDAVEAVDVKRVNGADQLAWSAYQYGYYDLAARWLARADANDPMMQWLSAKLLLRDGKVDAALKQLALASKSFPPEPMLADDYEQMGVVPRADWVKGEIGALRLARGEYVESLNQLLLGNYWQDAAYISERVLTADELIAYVDAHVPPPADPKKPDRLRYLLARRLLRLGRWKDARPYFPAELQPVLDQYISAIRSGHDAKRPAPDRAASLWVAAKTSREQGMELLGTELGPDGKIIDGSSTWDNGVDERLAVKFALVAPSADEAARLKRPPEQLEKRYHYRYIAADHAWAAAQLMPDNSNDLAQILNTAGTWLKNSDPQSADRFYKALLTRCPQTALAQKAKTLKWFVPIAPQPSSAVAN